jgi:hypothetical protein
MMVVIQCAASKQPEAGHLETAAGMPVRFVADPAAAPTDRAVVYARPDDPSDRGLPWRNVQPPRPWPRQNSSGGLYVP